MWGFLLGIIVAVIIAWAYLRVKASEEEVRKSYEEVMSVLYDIQHLQELHLPERTEKINAYLKLQTSRYAQKIRKSELSNTNQS